MNLASFQDELNGLNDGDELLDFCRKRVLHGLPYVFLGREDEYYEFRKLISEKFDIPFHEVYITGSGKLGFSPFKLKDFDYDSDIDVAIVSPNLFELFLKDICIFQWDIRESRMKVDNVEMKMYHSFLEYGALGWMRPDKLPVSFQMAGIKGDWFEFFDSISYNQSCVGDYKVNAGVFKSYGHLETYIVKGLNSLKKVETIAPGEKL